MDKNIDVINLDSVDIKDTQDDTSQISSVIKFMYIVQKIDKSIKNDDSERNRIAFFRGQSREVWKVDPSVFRGGQVRIEHELIREAIRRSPDELAYNLTNFERLTKLQHYELATRLLDISENPLVALYFACELEPEFDGAVYMTHTYPIYASSLEVQILSYIAHLDINGITLRDLWTRLKKEGIDIPPIEEDSSLVDNYINLIKRNYFVRANLDNARIKQQSGAFLLSGCIDTLINDNRWDSVLEKNDSCLAAEFTHKIVIPSVLKEELLEELDSYNINEATVYPELDHQMHYIKKKVNRTNTLIPVISYEGNYNLLEKEYVDFQICAKNDLSEQTKEMILIPRDLIKLISNYFKDDILSNDIYEIFVNSAKLDWPIRKQLQANISREITRYLFQKGYSIYESSEIAKSILDDALKSL